MHFLYPWAGIVNAEDVPNLLEHFIPLNSGKPEAVSICIIIAGALAVAFYEGSTAELFQTGTWRCQSLPRAFCTSTGVLPKIQVMHQLIKIDYCF